MNELRTGISYAMEEINPQTINVDHSYQRTLRKTYKKIRDQFDPLLVGVVTLSKRPNNTMWVIDGQHRLQAMKELGITNAKALVYTGLTLEEEAKIFSLQNLNRIKVAQIDLFNASKLINGTLFNTLHKIAIQNGTPIVPFTECGPRTIGLYTQKIAQFGTPKTKAVFKINKMCNKRLEYELYSDKIQRAIYGKLDSMPHKQIIERLNAIPNLRALIARSYVESFSNYGDLLD